MRARNVSEALRNLQTLIDAGAASPLDQQAREALSNAASVAEFEFFASAFGYHSAIVNAAIEGRTSEAEIARVAAVVKSDGASDLEFFHQQQAGAREIGITERPLGAVSIDTELGRQALIEQGEEAAERRVKDALIEATQHNAEIHYDPESDAFWREMTPGFGVASKIDLVASDLVGYLQGDPEAVLSFEHDDTGRLVSRYFDPELFTATPPEAERTDPFIGGIPADFVSNRRVVEGSQRFVDEVYRLNALEGVSLEEAAEIVRQEHPDIDGVVRFATPMNEEHDALTLFGGMDPSLMAEWQTALVRAGYLKHTDFLSEKGALMGQHTLPAMNRALFDAAVNGFGGEQNGGLTRWLQNRAASMESLSDEELAALSGRGPFVAPTFIKPDYDTLTNAVKQLMTERLGRKPTDTELQLLADGLGQDFRRQHAIQVEAARRQYDAENRFIVFGDETPQGGGSIQGVDPFDSLLALIDTKYENEIDTNRQVDELQQNTARFMQIMSGFERAVG